MFDAKDGNGYIDGGKWVEWDSPFFKELNARVHRLFLRSGGGEHSGEKWDHFSYEFGGKNYHFHIGGEEIFGC